MVVVLGEPAHGQFSCFFIGENGVRVCRLDIPTVGPEVSGSDGRNPSSDSSARVPSSHKEQGDLILRVGHESHGGDIGVVGSNVLSVARALRSEEDVVDGREAPLLADPLVHAAAHDELLLHRVHQQQLVVIVRVVCLRALQPRDWGEAVFTVQNRPGLNHVLHQQVRCQLEEKVGGPQVNGARLQVHGQVEEFRSIARERDVLQSPRDRCSQETENRKEERSQRHGKRSAREEKLLELL